MKNKIIALAVLFLTTTGIQAQIDRSTPPKAGPAPEINLEKPETFTLDNGLKVLVVENHKLPRVSMVLTMDNPPIYEGDKAGVSTLTGAMLGEGTKNISKEKFNEEVDYLGANMNFSSRGASANTLSKYFPRILELMAKGALNPDLNQEQFATEKERTLENLKSGEKDVSSNARRISSALTYGKDHPYGEFTTKESVEGLSLEDVKEFYNNYYVPQNAYLVIIGDVKPSEVKKLVKKNFGSWKKSELPKNTMPQVNNVAETQVNFVNFPNAVQSEVQVTNAIQLKKGDPDYFPVLIANKILGGGGEARLFLNLREDKGYTYGAYSSTGDDKYVARFVASASVRNAVTDSAVVAFLDELHRIRNEKVSEEELANAKAKYTGDFVLALERPTTIAAYALNIETDDLPQDFYQTYLKKINAVTAEDIQRVAKKYYLADNARIIVVGKGSEVAEKLENLSYNGKDIPVKYFDKYANAIEKPDYNKSVDPSVSVENIFNDYIKAIGGEEAVKDIESVYMIAQAELQGQKMDLETKVTSSGKSSTVVSMAGNVMQKQIFNGATGFVAAQGQKIPFTEEQVTAAKAEAHPFPEMMAKNATVEGIEDVDGEEAYAVKMDENTTNYYSKESGLKIKQVKTMKQGPQTMTIPITYSDYREVEGVKFPFGLSQSMGPMTLEFQVSEILVNENVTDADFE
ncbi:M16 family metallopeptidase [Salinimicrobium sediminilitoris]|uniref:M16 family metallopeptidase n=1 Tax=Salinimicrobium sediminilitoris TaxID=2876715 RepID=UPI001E305F50|nr:pitrilysin family protein [Salinimicrobium sediminilitoris]MCC8359267.1 insulinase family protein [Salinimicrobium sediminilitoris]